MRFVPVSAAKITMILLLVACQSAPLPTPLPTYTPYPTHTPYPTYTPAPLPERRSLPSAQIENLVWPTGPRDDVIPAEDAAAFLDDRVTVEGTVTRSHNSGNAVFLNISNSENSPFTAVIFPDDWPKFPSPPETLFAGKLVRVEGVIQEYNGTPEIIIQSPAQIEVALTLGQPINLDCNCPEPEPESTATGTPTPAATQPIATQTPALTATSAATPQSPPEIPPTEAANYAGQPVIIAGQVIDTYNSGKVVFLNFDEDYQTSFKVVIFPDAWPLFPESPELYFKGKTIRVSGTVKMYQNAPEIIVNQPSQIEVVE